MSERAQWSPPNNIDKIINSLDDPGTGRQVITPRDYLKQIEAADKAFDLMSSKKPVARGEANIHAMLAQTSGTLAADKTGLTIESGPRVSTESVGKVIKDRIPILMDSNYFRFETTGEKKQKDTTASTSTRRQ